MKLWLPYSIEDRPATATRNYRVFKRYEFGQPQRSGVMVWNSRLLPDPEKWRHSHISKISDYFSTSEEAMQSLDNYLIARGDYLIQEDEVERFKTKIALLL